MRLKFWEKSQEQTIAEENTRAQQNADWVNEIMQEQGR